MTLQQFTYKIKEKWQHSDLHTVYDLSDPYGRGRCRMLLSTVLDSIVAQLVNGLFYTSFLLYHGMDKSKIGFLTFIPYLTCMLNIFSPMIFERLQKRKPVLITSKLAYTFIQCIGIALLPSLISGKDERLAGLAVLIILATAISQLFNSGWSAWHANYLEEHVRIDYFRSSSCIVSGVSYAVALAISFVGDHLSGTPNEILLLTSMRYLAFGLMIVDAFIWLSQKEFPYVKTTRIKFSNIFTLPLKNKLFRMTMVILAIYHFATQIPNATLNAYLLEDVGVSYSLIYGINASYFLFFFFFTRMWNRVIFKFNMYRAFGLVLAFYGITFFLQGFVTANTVWLFVAVRLLQHIFGVFFAGVASSVLYDHLPLADRTNYLSFYAIVQNASIFLALMLGTLLAYVMGNGAVTVLGYPLTSTQLTAFAGCVSSQLLAVLCVVWAKVLAPPRR